MYINLKVFRWSVYPRMEAECDTIIQMYETASLQEEVEAKVLTSVALYMAGVCRTHGRETTCDHWDFSG